MADQQTANDIFQSVFQQTLLSDGFVKKRKSFYYLVNWEQGWLKTLNMHVYSSGRMFRICCNVHPFTEPPFKEISANMDDGHDLLMLRLHADPGYNPLAGGYFTLAPFMPSEESIQRVHNIYVNYFRQQFLRCQSLNEVLNYQRKLELMAYSGAWNEINRLYGYLYAGDKEQALIAAYLYLNQLQMHKNSFESMLAGEEQQPEPREREIQSHHQSIETLANQILNMKQFIETLEYGDASGLLKEAKERFDKAKAQYKTLFGR